MVNAGSARPSHAEMTAIGTDCACMMLAQECRASCNRICLTFGRAAQLPPEVAERVGVIRTPGVVDNDVFSLAEVVRAEPQPLSGLGRPRG
jgi:hypothetical protein